MKKIDFSIFDDFMNILVESLPRVAGILAFIIASWLTVKLVLFISKRIFKFSKIEVINQKLNDINIFESTGFKINISKILLFFIKWILILGLIILGADIFGLQKVSDQVGRILAYLPTLFSAILIFFAGVFLASSAQKSIKSLLKSFELSGSNSIGNLVFYILLIITIIISLNQLGVNTEIITDNISIVLGATLLALSISLGLGSKDIIERLLFGFYTRKNLQIGQKIIIEGDEEAGKIISIDNICMVLQKGEKKTIYPISEIVNKRIKIID
jgi:hypothetical protein